MTLAAIIAEADALEAQVQSAIDLRMPTLADESIARRDAFRAEHFPLLVAVAEAAVEALAEWEEVSAEEEADLPREFVLKMRALDAALARLAKGGGQ